MLKDLNRELNTATENDTFGVIGAYDNCKTMLESCIEQIETLRLSGNKTNEDTQIGFHLAIVEIINILKGEQ